MEEASLKQKTARTLKWNTIDKFASQVLYAVTGVVLANVLSKSDFGLVGAMLVFQAFASLFVDSGDVRIEGYIDNADKGVFAVAFRKADGSIIVVITNTGSEKMQINLPEGYTSLKAVQTDAQSSLETVYEGGYKTAFSVGAESVTTLVISR